MECPKCHEKLEAVACVPGDQRFTMELEFEGEHLAAATLGGVIRNTDKLLVSIAKNVGAKVTTMIESIEFKPHRARITFVIVAIGSGPTVTGEPNVQD